jgi:hypothetical protein
MEALNALQHLNTCFKHFLFFCFEYRFVDETEYTAVQVPIAQMRTTFKNLRTSRDSTDVDSLRIAQLRAEDSLKAQWLSEKALKVLGLQSFPEGSSPGTSPRSSCGEATEPTPFTRQDLVEAGLLTTHKYGLLNTAYNNCFVGSEVVTWMVELRKEGKLAETRESAIGMCRTMLAAGIIHHVCDEHHFKDGHLFYRFVSDDNIAPATAAAAAADLELESSVSGSGKRSRSTRHGSGGWASGFISPSSPPASSNGGQIDLISQLVGICAKVYRNSKRGSDSGSSDGVAMLRRKQRVLTAEEEEEWEKERLRKIRLMRREAKQKAEREKEEEQQRRRENSKEGSDDRSDEQNETQNETAGTMVDGSTSVGMVDGSTSVDMVDGSTSVDMVDGSTIVDMVDGSTSVGMTRQMKEESKKRHSGLEESVKKHSGLEESVKKHSGLETDMATLSVADVNVTVDEVGLVSAAAEREGQANQERTF